MYVGVCVVVDEIVWSCVDWSFRFLSAVKGVVLWKRRFVE